MSDKVKDAEQVLIRATQELAMVHLLNQSDVAKENRLRDVLMRVHQLGIACHERDVYRRSMPRRGPSSGGRGRGRGRGR